MLAICGGKGGSGKTTTTLGVARAVARRGRSVVAVDCDRDCPDLHSMAAVDDRPHLGDLSRRSDPAAACPASPSVPGVRVAPAPPAVGDVSIAPALDRLAGAFDVTLLDCPAGAGPDAAAPLRVADAAVVVTGPTVDSLEDAAKTAATARALGAEVAGAVVTRARRVPGESRPFGAPSAVAVPDARSPLADLSVDGAFEALVGDLLSQRII